MVGSPIAIPSSRHQHASICNINIIISFLLTRSRCFLSHWLIRGKDFRIDVFTNYGTGPELLGLIRYCTQYVVLVQRKLPTERSVASPIILRWMERYAGNWCPGAC